MSIIWNVSSDEQNLHLPCDAGFGDSDPTYWRGIDINAKAEAVFRWLCQMRVAPYSYDLIDNFGRQSPQKLIPGTDELQWGQTMMSIFKLVDFKTNDQLTLEFRNCKITYKILPTFNENQVKLIVKVRIRWRQNWYENMAAKILPTADLWMMKKQLRNFKRLAENSKATS